VQKRQNQIKYPNFKTPRGTPGHGHGAAAGPPLQRGGCTTKLKIQISKLPGGPPRKGQNQIKVPNFRAPRGPPRHGAARGPIPRAGPPADRENTPTTNTTGTFGSDVAVGLVFDIFSRSARGPRQNSGTAYEKTQRGLPVRSGRWILVRRVLPFIGCPGDTAEPLTKNTTGTSGPKRPLDPCSTCSPSRRVSRRHRRNGYENRNGDFRSEAAAGFVFEVFSLSPCPRRHSGTAYKNTTGTSGPNLLHVLI